MGHEKTAPFEALKNPPALRVEVAGLAHKASGLSPALVRSPVLSVVFRGNPVFGAFRGTHLIRLILCRDFCLSKRSAKTGQVRPEIGQGLFPYSVCESRTQANGAGFGQAVSFLWFFTGPALSRSRAEISFPALRQAISRGKVTFGFFRILTQTLTHTGIGVHGTSGTDRARERSFPSRKGRKPAGMSPHRIQIAAHNPKVVGSSPASATTKKPMKPWFHRFFLFVRNCF